VFRSESKRRVGTARDVEKVASEDAYLVAELMEVKIEAIFPPSDEIGFIHSESRMPQELEFGFLYSDAESFLARQGEVLFSLNLRPQR